MKHRLNSGVLSPSVFCSVNDELRKNVSDLENGVSGGGVISVSNKTAKSF